MCSPSGNDSLEKRNIEGEIMSEITLVSQDSTLQSADILNLMENLQSFQEKESIHGEITSIRDAVEELSAIEITDS